METESVQKMLRSVLQSSKGGVALGRLQADYSALCGERIPLRRLGFPETPGGLEAFLRSVPAAVRLEARTGELQCFAVVCSETRHIAELVARQKTSKKVARSQLVNCRLRAKPCDLYRLNGAEATLYTLKPSVCLRQPSSGGSSGSSGCPGVRAWPYGGSGVSSASGDYREVVQLKIHQKPAVKPSVCLRQPSSGGSSGSSGCPGVRAWPYGGSGASSASGDYREVVQLKIHQKPAVKPSVCLRQPSSGGSSGSSGCPGVRAWPYGGSGVSSASGDYREVVQLKIHQKPAAVACPGDGAQGQPPPQQQEEEVVDYSPELVQSRLSGLLAKHCSGLWLSKLPGVYLDMFGQTFPLQALRQLPLWTHVVSMEEISSTNGTTQLLYPPLPPKPAPVLSTAVQERLRDLLSKYSQGVWTHALPKIFLDTYKMVFPEEVLAHLPLLQHVCCVEYPAPHDRTKAILYEKRTADGQRGAPPSNKNKCCTATSVAVQTSMQLK